MVLAFFTLLQKVMGGPLSLAETGDIIEINVDLRSINMLVDEKTLQRKKKVKNNPKAGRGWLWMYSNHVRQANEGCDFDFLESNFGISAKEPDILEIKNVIKRIKKNFLNASVATICTALFKKD